MLKTKEEIEKWLIKMRVEDFIINDDLTVDVDGSVYLGYRRLSEIPVQFGKIKGSFTCQHNQLKSLKGCPKYVKGGFWCYKNQLESLKYCPEWVGEDFGCDDNQLKNLDYYPEHVGRGFVSDIGQFSKEEYKQFVKLQKRKEKLNNLKI